MVNFGMITNYKPPSGNAWEIDNQHQITASTATSGSDYVFPVSGKLTEGVQYKASITISSKTGAGLMGFSTHDDLGNDIGWGSDAPQGNVDGTYTDTFTAAGNYYPRIFAGDSTTGVVSASITQVGGIDFNNSVAGTLDVGNSEDFPLSMNFSVADARNLNSRTGTYSKTFKIPATKNNNRILKYSYNEGYKLDSNTISNEKECRIEVDDTLSIVGLLQVTAIGKASQPKYYSCVFYGNNVGWASSLGEKMLKDLSVRNGADGSGWDNLNGKGNGVNLEANRTEIIKTWKADDAVYKTSSGTQSASDIPIVYPIVGYGENNAGGAEGRLQLLKTKHEVKGGAAATVGYYGFYNSGDAYPTPIPSMDWRPAIFIYDIIKQIFFQEGYSIVSTFIDSNMFKGLTMLLPNFRYNNVDERVAANSIYGSFTGTAYVGNYSKLTELTPPSSSPSDFRWEADTIHWDGDGLGGTNKFVTTGNSAIYDDSSGFFTITEFGFYDISMENIGCFLSSVCEGDSEENQVVYIRISCQVQTVGQTSWKDIGNAYALTYDEGRVYDCPIPNVPGNKRSLNFAALQMVNENQWLNKGDNLRFRMEYKMGHNDSTDKTMGWEVFLFGGSNPENNDSDGNGLLSIVQRGERVEYGQTFDLKNVIDNESTQMGFLRGVIHAFNLQFTTDLVSKTVYIEPFNDFYKEQKDAIDWTYKVDLSRIQEDKWVQSELRRELIFKYKTDSNDKVVEHVGNTYWDGILDELPYREFTGTEFPSGQSIFENPFFAGCYNSQDGQTYAGAGTTNQTPYRANLWGLCDTGAVPTAGSSCRPEKGYNFVPRLVNYVKNDYAPNPLTPIRFAAGVQVFGDTDLMTIIPGYSSQYVTPNLVYANSVDNFTLLGKKRNPLTYGSASQRTYDFTTNSIGSSSLYKGLYQEYYQQMIEQIKANPRIKTVYVNLKLSDINNLDLRKLVYIDGYYYRINQIIDYNPNNNEVTKVELVLWEDKGVFTAQQSSF